MNVEVRDSRNVDFTLISDLLREAFFEERINKRQDPEVLRFMSPEALQRKYERSEGAAPSKIALIFDHGTLVSMNGLLSIKLTSDIQGWMSCDTATHREFRGRGLFRTCIQALQDELPGNTIIFGFPNKNSINTFLKLGWSEKQELSIWTKPVLSTKSDSSIYTPSYFNLDLIYDSIGISLSSDYIEWRFGKSPNLYKMKSGVSNGEQFVAIARKYHFKSVSLLMIMEIKSQGIMSFRAAIKELTKLARRERCGFLLISPNARNRSYLASCGFFKIPRTLQSRPLKLLGMPIGGGKALELWRQEWDTSLGYWDAL
jgi:hypothetical protein